MREITSLIQYAKLLIPKIYRFLPVLWWVALGFACVNAVYAICQAPQTERDINSTDEVAVESTAKSLSKLPVNARLLLLRKPGDNAATWFGYRLNYLVYPRHLDSAWNNLPTDVARSYDVIVKYGVAELVPPVGWAAQLQAEPLLIYTRPDIAIGEIGNEPLRRNMPGILGVALGPFSLVAMLSLGALLVGRCTPLSRCYCRVGARV
jgi:hypothetical protein